MFVDLFDVYYGWFKIVIEKYWIWGCIINMYRIINMYGLRYIFVKYYVYIIYS